MNIAHNSFSITFIGHSTFLMRMGDITILTDPYYEGTLGGIMPRTVRPPIGIDKLPEISLITITHSHFDHLSLSTLKRIKRECPVLVPMDTAWHLKKLVFPKVIEINWGETLSFGQVSITALPSEHQSARYFIGRKAVTNSYLFGFNGKTIYFVGDSGYSHIFREIGEKYAIDVAVLPIGMATPSILFGKNHLNPCMAIKAFLDLKATRLIPAHFGTFRTILENSRWPLREFKKQAIIHGIQDKVNILDFGVPWEFGGISNNSFCEG